MQIKRKTVLGAVATLAVVGLAFGVAPAANADPSGPPAPRLLNGTGSDTTQDVNNGLASVVKDSTGNLVLGSWNATGSATIMPVTTTFNRPNGSGNGVQALKSAKDATALWGGVNLVDADLQFARSSSAPTAAQSSPTGAYQYIPLAVDAVSYARHATNTVVGGNIPLGTSVGDDADGDGIFDLTLKNIYGNHPGISTFSVEVTPTSAPITVGNQASGAQIVPFIPQAGSGTRSFWQSTLGAFGPQADDEYTDASGTHGVQEHDGSVLNASAALRASAIVPFSIAQYIAQEKIGANPAYYNVYTGVNVTDRRNGATLGQVDGINPRTGSTGTGVLNPSFPVKRPVFTVAQKAQYDSSTTAGAELRATFGPSGKAYTTLRPGSSDTVLADFGFGVLDGGVDFVINGGSVAGVTPGEVSNRFRANP